jgi:23S rRNA pseudouridine955/2504/2580 synthase
MLKLLFRSATRTPTAAQTDFFRSAEVFRLAQPLEQARSISKLAAPSKNSVIWQEVDEGTADQRVDNYLFRLLKGVPKSHVYRILRSGEVRVNSRRVDASYRLQPGDRVRVPPVRVAAPVRLPERLLPALRFRPAVLFEDDWLLAIDKPAGLAVHGGSGISRGVVELLRQADPSPFLELVHRLDKETSGILVLAKKRRALIEMHTLLREGRVEKRYLALVRGRWRDDRRNVRLPLHKFLTATGERRVSVLEGGQASHTVFRLMRRFGEFSLLEAELKTGRTHQIRVQLAHLDHPIAGDGKYGDFELNRMISKQGMKRMFLHACQLAFEHPVTAARIELSAPLPAELQAFLDRLEPSRAYSAARPIPGA